MRIRKQLITNLYVKPKDIKALANGKRIYKRANHHAHCIIPQQVDSKKEEKIAKLEAQLAKLKGKPVEQKQKYTKRNIEYWAKQRDKMREYLKTHKIAKKSKTVDYGKAFLSEGMPDPEVNR